MKNEIIITIFVIFLFLPGKIYGFEVNFDEEKYLVILDIPEGEYSLKQYHLKISDDFGNIKFDRQFTITQIPSEINFKINQEYKNSNLNWHILNDRQQIIESGKLEINFPQQIQNQNITTTETDEQLWVYFLIIPLVGMILLFKFLRKDKSSDKIIPKIKDLILIPDNSQKENAKICLKWNIENELRGSIEVTLKNKLGKVETQTVKEQNEVNFLKLSKGEYYEFKIKPQFNCEIENDNKKYFFTSNTLNENQQEAVSFSYESPMQVIAGPGTGKTHVILERVKDLVLNQNVSPEKILCLTFNKKAAKEMKNRMNNDVDFKNNQILIRNVKTYNSFASMLKGHSYKINLKKVNAWFLNLVNTFDFQYIQQNFDDKEEFVNKLKSTIGAFRKEKISPQDLKSYCSGIDELEKKSELLEFCQIYQQYLDFLSMERIDDYDDQLLGCYEQLKNDNEWTRKFDHIIIDEYQDNNYLHTQIAKQLSSKAQITIVGDPDQTINTFQGSNTANFEDFDNYYNSIKPVKTINLVQNYRSTKNIIDISNQFIKKIIDPKRMELITNREAEKPIKIIRCDGEKEEFDFLHQEIRKLHEFGCKFSEIGILARSNKKGREINDFLQKKGIQSKFKETEDGFVTVGTVHFFKGTEYKIIFIFDVMDKTFPISFRNSELKVPISMRHYKPKLSNEEEHYNEERRIFYVAMTRAKDELFIITKISKDFEDSEYVNEMIKKPQVNEIKIKLKRM